MGGTGFRSLSLLGSPQPSSVLSSAEYQSDGPVYSGEAECDRGSAKQKVSGPFSRVVSSPRCGASVVDSVVASPLCGLCDQTEFLDSVVCSPVVDESAFAIDALSFIWDNLWLMPILLSLIRKVLKQFRVVGYISPMAAEGVILGVDPFSLRS